jgi:hypothetical protein
MYWHINLEHDYIDNALGCLSHKNLENYPKNTLEKIGDDTVSRLYSVVDY